MIIRQKAESSERGHHISIKKEAVSGRGPSKCKGPEVGACSAQTRNKEQASVAGPEWEVKRVVGEENRGMLKWSEQTGQGSPGHGKT